jgi:hypothetical protein
MGRTKTALNIELARTLAQKEHHQAAVRRAFGQLLVVETLEAEARNDQQARANKLTLERAISLALNDQ